MVKLFLIGFLSSIIGAICGIGGGVIIKPCLDLIGFASADVINFLSGLTVLSMSFFSIIFYLIKNKKFDYSIALPLSLGAAIGGILGSKLFNIISTYFDNSSKISLIQSIILAIICIFIIIYTIYIDKIKTKHNSSIIVSCFIGLSLGLIGSFLGIGGGPFNLLILSYFFSFNIKDASIYSLFIILVSQIFSLIFNIVNNSIPYYELQWVIIMVISGIVGGYIGNRIHSQLDSKAIDKLFIFCLFFIIFICIYNSYKFMF